MADDLGIMLTELPEAESISDNDLLYLVSENNSEKVKAKTIKDSLLGDFYGEASGNPASFADGSESALVECKAEIVPVQDLHGYSKPWAGGAGKNQAEGRYTWNINASGVIIESSSYATCIVKVSQGTTYTFSVDGVKAQIDVIAYFTSYPQVGSTSYNDSRDTFIDGTFTASITGYAAIRMSASIGDMMVENGSSASSYEPYANICPISGHSSVTINVSPTNDPSQGVDTTIQLGDTYYGGTFNAVTGELTLTHGFKTYTGDASENWIYTSTLNRVYINIPDAYRSPQTVKILSNMLHYSTSQEDYGAYINDQGNLVIFAPSTITSASDWETWLSSNNVQVVYQLATPITVQLDPTEIATLLGQNYISSDDTENIDVVYTKSGAPIKPNPSGEPDGYLSSIELSGKKFEIIKELPAFPSSNGNYKLKLSISNGVPTLSWVADT